MTNACPKRCCADRRGREAAEGWPDAPGVGWPSWAFENHDAPRALSRWTPEDVDPAAYARMKMALLCALRGNIILYNGEELGLGQVEIPFELVKDPEARKNWPLTLSRDGARTPLPLAAEAAPEIGRAACRERGCEDVV